MIVKIRNKLYDSNKESIAVRFDNKELARLAHHYLSRNPPETIIVLNGTRRDDNVDDALLTSAEAKKFVSDLDKYLKKNYPDKHKPVSSIEVV